MNQSNRMSQPYPNMQPYPNIQPYPNMQPYPNNQSFDLNKKISELEQENLNLKKTIQEKDKTISSLNQTITSLNNQIQGLNNQLFNNAKNNLDNSKMLELMEQMNTKINKLKPQINQKNQLNANIECDLKNNEKLLPIVFISNDQKMIYSVICKNTDSFYKTEEMLYKKYPEYKITDNSFLCNGAKVNRFDTIENNKLDYSSIVTLNQNQNQENINKNDE